MDPGIVATTGRLVFMPVRHHSPACARAVQAIAQELRPAMVLIEGPADFNERLDELYLPHRLPIAIYSYVRMGDNTRRGAFYPFCEHSPEWEALLVARELGAGVRFIDLPWMELASARTVSHRYADRELRESPYIPRLCEKLGVEDFDSLWDRLIEVDPALTPAQLVERVHHFCFHVRANSSHISEEDLRREAFMARQIRSALESCDGPVLVVTGGFHSYALYAALHGFPSIEPATALHGTQETEHAPGEPQPVIEHGIALTPFADLRLDSLSGYEAGMPSPGFYHQVWADRAAGKPNSYRTLLAQAVERLRERGQIASTADLIAVESVACSLAALRGQAQVWRRDLIDAIISALIKEAIEPGTQHPFLDAIFAVFRGDKRGKLADGVLLPPLVYDIQEQLKTHELEPQPVARSVRLDLALAADLERSRVLHRLRILGIHGFVRRDGTDFVGRSDLTTVWEVWEITWSPDFDAACIEAAIYGAALPDATAMRLTEQAGAIERSAEQAGCLLLDACLAGLSAQSEQLLERLVVLVRQDADFFSVAGALGHLLYLYRYDDTLGVTGSADIGGLLVEAFQRVLWLLEMLGQPQGRDRDLIRSLRAIVQTFEACEQTLALDRMELVDILRRTAEAAAQRPLVRGAATGALWTLGEAAIEQVRVGLQASAAPEALGDFLTGLFALARETVQRHQELVATIDRLMMDFDDAAYLQALPAMRLAFSFFTPREKHYIARTLLDNQQGNDALPELEVGVAIAARALAVESRLLELVARYGVRGGQNE